MKDKALPRLGRGELLALVGAFGLWPTLFADWWAFEPSGWTAYSPHPEWTPDFSGWTLLGSLADGFLCAAMLSAVILVAARLVRRGPVSHASASRLAIAAGTIAFVALPVAVLRWRVDHVRWPAVAALVFTALIPAGGVMALGDARRAAAAAPARGADRA